MGRSRERIGNWRLVIGNWRLVIGNLNTNYQLLITNYQLPGLIGVVVIYAILSFYQVNLPGLHYDEAFEVGPALQLVLGQPVTAFRGGGLSFGGQTLPLMTQDYIGALNSYLALPFIAALGATPAAPRAMSVIIGMATLVLSYSLAYQLTQRRQVGLVVALLLAVDHTFIFWNRQGVFVTAITAPIGLGVAYCGLRRLQIGQDRSETTARRSGDGALRWSIAGAFLMGLGIYAKLLFVWLVAALLGSWLLLSLPRVGPARSATMRALVHSRPSPPFPPTKLALMVGAFLVGCWPLIAYNLQTGGTFLSLTQNASTSFYGVNNLAFGANLGERLSQLAVFLKGGQLWYLGGVYEDVLALLFFGGFFVLVVVITTRNIFRASPPLPSCPQALYPAPAQVALFPFLVIGLVTLASISTVSALWITHFAILMPWPALAVGLGSWFMLRNLDGSAPTLWGPTLRGGKFLIYLGLGLLVVSHLVTTLRYHRVLTESGGLSSHSDAIYDLSDWLDQHAQGAVVAMDWGLAAPVAYLTAGRVRPVEIFGYAWQSDAQLNQRLSHYIAHPDTLYLWRAPDEIIFDRSGEFKALYRPQQLQETIEAAFYERSGRPILGVTRLVACGAPGVISPEPAAHCR